MLANRQGQKEEGPSLSSPIPASSDRTVEVWTKTHPYQQGQAVENLNEEMINIRVRSSHERTERKFHPDRTRGSPGAKTIRKCKSQEGNRDPGKGN